MTPKTRRSPLLAIAMVLAALILFAVGGGMKLADEGESWTSKAPEALLICVVVYGSMAGLAISMGRRGKQQR